MARARTLKPGFFANEQLAECSPSARLLFQALWCVADREGRLEDRPKRLKAFAFPYENVDIEILLAEIESRKFIVRYSVGEGRFIQVANFTKHQNPHAKETASTYPAPCALSPRKVRVPKNPEPSPAIPERAPEIPERAGPSSLTLLPIPLSPFPSPHTGPPAPVVKIEQQIVDAWNEIAPPMLARIQKLTDGRIKLIKARLGDAGGLGGMRTAFEKVAASPFCRGERSHGEHAGFRAEFDWIMTEKHFVQLMEGKFDDREPTGPGGGNGRDLFRSRPPGQDAVGVVAAVRKILDKRTHEGVD